MLSQFPIAVGDLHGRADLLEQVIHHFPGRQFVFLGDYVDRGPDSRACISKIRELVRNGEAIACLGNHDQMMIDAILSQEQAAWLSSGGDKTLDSYMDDREVLAEDVLWMKEHLYPFYVYKHILFSHAMRPSATDPLAYLVGRPFDTDTSPLPEGITLSVHGHTPARGPDLFMLEDGTQAAYIDTGAYKTGKLCALDCESMLFYIFEQANISIVDPVITQVHQKASAYE